MTNLPSMPITLTAAPSVALTDTFTVKQAGVQATATLGMVNDLLNVPVIILDTDLASDVDDVGDLAMVAQACLTGKARCLAMIAGNLHPNGATGIKVLLDYALPGHNILVGQYNGGTLSAASAYNGSAYLDQIVSRFGQGTKTFGNHINVVRQALAYARPSSISYVMTGFGSVLADVLKSGPDSASPLNGAALFKAKVKAIYWEAGSFPIQTGGDFNIAPDVAAAQYIVATMPGLGIPIFFSGGEIAGALVTGADRITAAPPVGADPTISPFEYAFELFGYSATNQRNAWGNTSVWPAIYGIGPLFRVGGVNGTVTINANSNASWAAAPAAGQSYLSRLSPIAEATAAFNAGIAIASGNHNTAGGTWGTGIGLPGIGKATTSPVSVSSNTPPLDAVNVLALGAWGLRKLRAAYTGAAILVQRSSDSTQLAVGFTSGGTLDTGPLLTFVGSGAGRVVRLYDQTGNGWDAVQATANNAEIVYQGGVVASGASNGPAMFFFDAANNGLNVANFPLTGGSVTINAVASLTGNQQYKNLVSYQATGAAFHYDNAGSASMINSVAGQYSLQTSRNGVGSPPISVGSGSQFTSTAVYDGTSASFYVNAATAVMTSTGSFGPTGTLSIGSVLDTGGSVDCWAGAIAEVIIYPSALSSVNRAALIANQQAFFGTP